MKPIHLIAAAILIALHTIPSWSQNVKVTGNVSDEAGEPLIGAGIIVHGQKEGVITDIDGNFSIDVPAGTMLEISYLGYETQTLPAVAGQPMKIRLKEVSTMMDEVVVVGYGVQKKINLTGSVAQISGNQIADKTTPNVMASLQGELPGVVVTQTSGQPGEEGFSLQIRGHSSVNAIQTLVLIDGIEGDLDMLNPNDIESISVLKDAASASIYGSKAAAGVILVTTKQGAAEKVTISYNGSYSFTRSGRKPSRINSWEE